MKHFNFLKETEWRRPAIQFFKFGLVGLSNTVVSMAVYYVTLWANPDWYLLGSVLGTVLSIANAFFWNDRFVFVGNARDFFSVLRRLGKTYVSYGGTSAISVFLLWAEVAFFQVNRSVAPIVNLLVTIPLNFLINKFWTFRNESETFPPEKSESDLVQKEG